MNNWTTAPPEEPGLYRWKGNPDSKQSDAIHVTRAPCGVLVVFDETSVADWGGWWGGIVTPDGTVRDVAGDG